MAALPNALRHLFQSRGDEEPDPELLRRFASCRDEAAFETLVRRHGPLVFGVCRRVAGRSEDAEDAFQATFLALARRADADWGPTVAGWLQAVAWRAANRLRKDEARRRRHEAAARPAETAPQQPTDETALVLDEELSSLPDTYRTPIVLCYREGETRDQAARRLGLSLRTLHRRLERGRELLRARLVRRGLAPAVALAALARAQGVAPAVPQPLLAAAIRGALSGAPAHVGALAAAALRGTSAAKPPLVAALLLTAGLAAGVGGLAGRPDATAPEAKPPTTTQPGDRPGRPDRDGDALPEGALARLGTSRLRGSEPPIAFSPDGKTLACVRGPDTVLLWDRVTGRPVRQLRLPRRSTFRGLSFSPDGRLLACSTNDRENVVLVVATGAVAYTHPGAHGTFADDGKTLVSADTWGEGPQVHVLDAATGRRRGGWALERGTHRLSLSADGRRVALIDDAAPKEVRVFDVPGGKELRRITVGNAGQLRTTLSPDGQTVALTVGTRAGNGSCDVVELWDVGTGKRVRAWKKRSDSAPVFAPDGRTLAWSGFDEDNLGIARTWVVKCDEEKPRPLGEPTNSFEAPCFTPDGKVLAVPTDAGAIRLWDVAGGKEALALEGHASPVGQVVSGPGVVATRDRNAVLVWGWPSGTLLRRFEGEYAEGEEAVALLGRDRVLVGEDGEPFRVCELATGREVVRLEGKHHTGWFQVTPDGRTAALLDQRGLGVYDLTTGKARYQVGQRGERYGFGLSADGRILVRLWEEGRISRVDLTDIRTGRALPLPGLEKLPRGPSFIAPARCLSPDGRWFVYPGSNALRRWDVEAGKEVRALPGAPARVFEIFYSPDGRLVACRGDDGREGGGGDFGKRSPVVVRVWEVGSGRLLSHLDPGPSPEEGVWFSADGRTLFTRAEGAVRLWEVATGRPRGKLGGHHGGASSLGLSRDGRTLFTGGRDAQVLAWDLSGGARPGLSEVELRQAWEALARPEAEDGWQAMWRLAADPKRAVPFLRDRLRPVARPDPARVARLIADLEGRFAVRQRAAEELEAMAEPVAPLLREALGRGPALDTRRRLEGVLEQIEGPVPTGPRLQAVRAVEALEYMGTAEARRLLERLAGGAAGARLTEEARQSAVRADLVP